MPDRLVLQPPLLCIPRLLVSEAHLNRFSPVRLTLGLQSCTWGPKLGMRQMITSRYSFGYYGVIVPCIFNLIGMIAFSILNSIIGGQALASVNGDLSWTSVPLLLEL